MKNYEIKFTSLLGKEATIVLPATNQNAAIADFETSWLDIDNTDRYVQYSEKHITSIREVN